MLKKIGTVAVGITAGLVAMAPLASAGECPPDQSHPHGHSHGSGGHDNGGNSGHSRCDFTGGEAAALSDISGDSQFNTITQLPTGGNNALNLLDCSSFLNNNLNDNFTGNNVALVGDNALIGD